MDYVTIQVERVEAETDLALLLVIDEESVWVPKSLIEEPDDYEVGNEDVEVEIAEWFCKREGLA